MKLLAAVSFALLAACHPTPAPSGDPTATPPPKTATPTPDPTPGSAATPVEQSGGAFGAKCGANDACPTGQECVSYRGIAGASGPLFKSCEVKCTDASVCGAGHRCATIADGPGRVCR